MLLLDRDRTRRIVVTGCAAIALLCLPAFAQPDPAQQALQVQQVTMTAVQAAQQANDQMMLATQLAIQQAMQAAMSTPSGPQRTGYGRADKPTFSPRPGKFQGPVSVTISAPSTPKAEIFYTLDGSAPTTASTRYIGPIQVTASTKLRAIARAPIYSLSRAVGGMYVIR